MPSTYEMTNFQWAEAQRWTEVAPLPRSRVVRSDSDISPAYMGAIRTATVNPPSSREIVRASAEANYGFGKWFKKVEKAYPLTPKKARKYTKKKVDNDPVIEVLSTGT